MVALQRKLPSFSFSRTMGLAFQSLLLDMNRPLFWVVPDCFRWSDAAVLVSALINHLLPQ